MAKKKTAAGSSAKSGKKRGGPEPYTMRGGVRVEGAVTVKRGGNGKSERGVENGST